MGGPHLPVFTSLVCVWNVCVGVMGGDLGRLKSPMVMKGLNNFAKTPSTGSRVLNNGCFVYIDFYSTVPMKPNTIHLVSAQLISMNVKIHLQFLTIRFKVLSWQKQTFNRAWNQCPSLRWPQWLEITGSFMQQYMVIWPYHVGYYFQSLKLALRFHALLIVTIYISCSFKCFDWWSIDNDIVSVC